MKRFNSAGCDISTRRRAASPRHLAQISFNFRHGGSCRSGCFTTVAEAKPVQSPFPSGQRPGIWTERLYSVAPRRSSLMVPRPLALDQPKLMLYSRKVS
jgi:hypothetical protein